MTQQDILEANKLIAEFRGVQVIECNGELCHYKSMYTVEYHTSWDWLMPVVQGIKKLQRPLGGLNLHDIKMSAIHGALTNKYLNIEDLWICVVEFIKYYNQNNSKQ
jgi:hypothetical protein